MANLPRLVLAASTAVCAFVRAVPALAEEAGEAPAIIVHGRSDGYDIVQTLTATKTQTPLIDVPQAISVISREQLDDQGLESLGEALRYVPGVVLGQGEGHRDQVTLRGQNSTADFFLDGIRDDAQYYRPLYNVERVEVLKGANALIFGRGGGGGVINRVSKSPLIGKSLIAASAGADSFGAWSLAGDIAQPLTDTIALRLNATHEQFDNHREVYQGHFTGVAPTLGLRFSDATSLVLAYEYADDRRVTDRGIPSLGGVPIRGFDKTFFGDPAINRSVVTAHIARARLNHAFSDSLSANVAVQYASYDKRYANIFPRGVIIFDFEPQPVLVEFEGYENTTDRRNWIAQGNLVWQGSTGPIDHTLLIGFDAADQDTSDLRLLATYQSSPSGPTSTRVRVPLAKPIVLPATSFNALSRSTTSQVKARSGYIQDQIEIGDHLQIVAGLRYDDFRIAALNRIGGFIGTRSDGKWSPRVGLIVKPRANLSIYASFARSFLPQSGEQFTALDITAQALAPEEFRNLEAGVKWNVTDGLALTMAAYRLDRRNTRTGDPLSGNPLAGRSRAKGFEVALTGRIAPSVQVNLGYAYQDGEITSDILSGTTRIPAGRRLAQLPKHQITAWTRYDFTGTFGIGLGLIHQSDQFTTISNAVRLPAFTRLDAALFFDLSDQVTLQLNVENLTDTNYFPAAHTDYNISVGEPLNAKVTVRAKF